MPLTKPSRRAVIVGQVKPLDADLALSEMRHRKFTLFEVRESEETLPHEYPYILA